MSKGKELATAERIVERCGNCRFWYWTEALEERAVAGTCQRHAPAPLALTDANRNPVAVWPQTDPQDWCGEWQAVRLPAMASESVPCSFEEFVRPLSVRANRVLAKNGIVEVRQLANLTRDQVHEWKNCGLTVVMELEKRLAEIGLTFLPARAEPTA